MSSASVLELCWVFICFNWGEKHIWLMNQTKKFEYLIWTFIGWLPDIFYRSAVKIMWQGGKNTENSQPHRICKWTWCTVTMIFPITDVFLLHCFRNCSLVTCVQSRRCCRLLTINIWSRTKRAYCWSEVRNVFSFHVASDSVLLFDK